MEEEKQEGIESLVGKPLVEALKLLEAAKWKARIVSEDGESFGLTFDYQVDRVNLAVENQHVIEAYIG